MRRKRINQNTQAFSVGAGVEQQKSVVDHAGLKQRPTVSTSMQFTTKATETDWAIVVNQMRPALEQFQACLRALNAVGDDNGKNRGTACASIELEIRNASMIADAMAAVATVGRLFTVAEHTEKREKASQALNDTVKTDITNAVKRSAQQRKETTSEEKNRRGRSWRNVAAIHRPQLPKYSWSVNKTVL